MDRYTAPVGRATVELHDVRDAEAFCAAVVAGLGLRLGHHDREDLEARALEEMLMLARRYRPAHQSKGWPSFSSYAGDMLPKRVLTTWHKQQGHRRTRDRTTGARGWDYGGVASLDALMAAPAFDEAGAVTDWARFERPRIAA